MFLGSIYSFYFCYKFYNVGEEPTLGWRGRKGKKGKLGTSFGNVTKQKSDIVEMCNKLDMLALFLCLEKIPLVKTLVAKNTLFNHLIVLN